ncbi:AraC family transcriptional regulator [Paenibacillus illinoisensis]|uniref:helix-turn-helix transcriptional regulator n=1 Tax=Paenibacillus illinoisensis TaxID=59845 RepID=UPI003016EF8B
MLRVKTLIRGVELFPSELERWYINKDDFIYIQSDDEVEICFNRIRIELNGQNPGLIQYSYGPFSIRNICNHSVRIQGIKFSCGIKMQKNFFTTNFEYTPFLSMIQKSATFEACCSGIIKILDHIKSPHQLEVSRDRIDPRLIQLNRYIRKNYTTSITLQDLADYVGVHPTYLSNTYSKVFNISPIFYINQLRMITAEELLSHSNIAIKDIASKIGYNSVSQFSSIFKRFHSKTPSQYREDSLKLLLNE